MSNTRGIKSAPLRACPKGCNTNPARTRLIIISMSIPMKFYFNPTISIGPNFFIFFACNNGCLRAINLRKRCFKRGTVRDFFRKSFKGVFINKSFPFFIITCLMMNFMEDVSGIIFFALMVGEIKDIAT